MTNNTVALYDLFSFNKATDEVLFLMRAPVGVIGEYLRLHRNAVVRIERQCAVPSGMCALHDDRMHPGFVMNVLRAHSPLGINRETFAGVHV